MSGRHREVCVRKPGGFGRLTLVERESPALGPGQVRIAVSAAGVNYADCAVRMGLYSAVKTYPVTPGFEVAGTVLEIAEGVRGLKAGDRVFAVTRFGGYTSELVVGAEQVFRLPESWSFEQGAAFPAVHLTAWHALVDLAHLQEGETVLVHSAAGGVGTAACGIAARLGAKVIGVVRGEHKGGVAQRHGAGSVIDRSAEALWSRVERLAPSGCDVVLDANGVATLRGSYEHLALSGRLLVYGFATMLPRGRGWANPLALAWNWLRTPRFDPLALTTENRAVIGFNVVYQFERVEHFRRAIATLLDWVADGSLRAPEVQAFPLERAADAHRAIMGGKTTGKLVLTVDSLEEVPGNCCPTSPRPSR